MVTAAARFRDALAALGLSQRGFARATGTDERTARRYAAEGAVVPDWVWAWLEARIASPPSDSTPGDDRDVAAHAALHPHIDRLVERAREAGWAEPETLTAVIAIVVDRMRTVAGDVPTRQTLAAAIRVLDEESSPHA